MAKRPLHSYSCFVSIDPPLCLTMLMRSAHHRRVARDAVAARDEIEKLRFQLTRFKRTQFGCSSEKIAHTIERRGAAIETLDEDTMPGGPHLFRLLPKRSEQQASMSPARRPPPLRGDCPPGCVQMPDA
jgi:hypothetical protein